MVALDTNVLVRYLTNDHTELSPKAAKIILEAKPNTLLIDRLIIEELGYVLSAVYGFEKSKIADVYRVLLSHGTFTVPDKDQVEQTVELFDSEKPLSFEDCWLLMLKQTGSVESVATFDKDLQKRLVA